MVQKEFKRFTQEELTALESKIFAKPLTAEDVASTLADVRSKYLKECTPRLEGKSLLWNYTDEFNKHFGASILIPSGICCYTSTQYHAENLKLNLLELLFAREQPKDTEEQNKTETLWARTKRTLSRITSQSATFAEIVQKEFEKNNRYRDLKTTKYKILFEQFETFDWSKVHMHYVKPPKIEIGVGNAQDIMLGHIISTSPEYLEAQVSIVTVKYEVKTFT